MHTQILHTCTQCNCAWYLFFWLFPFSFHLRVSETQQGWSCKEKTAGRTRWGADRFYLGIQCLQIVHWLLNTMHIKIHKTMKDNEYPEENTQWAESHDTGGPKERDHQDIQSAIYWRSVPVAANCAWNLRMCTATFCIMGTSSSEIPIVIRLYWTKDW